MIEDSIYFAHDELVFALESLVRRTELGVATPLSILPTPPHFNDRAPLVYFMERQAARVDVEIELVNSPAVDMSACIRDVGPALIEVPGDEHRWIAILGSRRDKVQVLTTSLELTWVKTSELAEKIVAGQRAPIEEEIGSFLAHSGLPKKALEKATRGMTNSCLREVIIEGIWMVRTPPSRSFRVQLKKSGLMRRAVWLAIAQLCLSILMLSSWWIIGSMSLGGQASLGWILAWVLSLVGVVALRAHVQWQQSEIVLRFGGLLRRRLLTGALSLDANTTKRDGVGRLLGFVLECEDLERNATSGVLLVALSVIDVLPAALILWLGAASILHGIMFPLWLVAFALTTRSLYKLRSGWTRERLQITQSMTDALLGHRTRLAQLPRERHHLLEDHELARYCQTSSRLDHSRIILRQILARGWLVAAMGALAPAVWMGADTSSLAISIGGVLYAYAGFERMSMGLEATVGAYDSWSRVKTVFDAPENISHLDISGTHDSSQQSDETLPIMETSNLTFRYPNRSEPVFSQVRMALHQGDRVLLCGPSGSGKSTFAALLAAQHRQSEGIVLLNGLDLSTVGTQRWRRRVAFVPQFHENHILAESLQFNLLMARQWPPRLGDFRDAYEICQELGLEPLLDAMPAGLSQMVGDMGWNLSHGEKSRVFLARALLQDPEILILDESLAALDPELMEQVARAVVRRSRTLIVIAHP